MIPLSQWPLQMGTTYTLTRHTRRNRSMIVYIHICEWMVWGAHMLYNCPHWLFVCWSNGFGFSCQSSIIYIILCNFIRAHQSMTTNPNRKVQMHSIPCNGIFKKFNCIFFYPHIYKIFQERSSISNYSFFFLKQRLFGFDWESHWTCQRVDSNDI